MSRYLSAITAVFIAALVVLAPAGAYGAAPAITGVKVDEGHPLRVSFTVSDAFTSDIEEAVRSGIPTSFTFRVRLDRAKTLWMDEDMGTWEFKHTVNYDTLKQVFEVVLDEKGGKVVRTEDFEEMKALMTTCDGVILTPRRPLEGGQRYTFRIMAELNTIRLPFLLDYMLFFLRFWDVETDWHTHSFTR